MKKDVYKLDARVTVLFSQAQVDAMREIAHEEQTSVSGLVRTWVISEMQNHYLENLQNKIRLVKENQDD